MDRYSFAERLVRIAYGRRRAAEIVGDFLEEDSGSLRFLLSVAQVMFASSWRWIVGILVASASSLALMVCFSIAFLRRTGLPLGENAIWFTAGLCCCSVLAINVCTFGLRDRVTTAAAGLTAVLVGIAYASLFFQAPYLWWLAAATILVIGLLSEYTRKPVLVLSGAAISYAGVLAISTRVLVVWPGTNRPRALICSLICCWLAGFICESWVLARTRRFVHSS